MNCFILLKCKRRGIVSGLAGNQTNDSCISLVKSSTNKLTWPIFMIHKALTINPPYTLYWWQHTLSSKTLEGLSTVIQGLVNCTECNRMGRISGWIGNWFSDSCYFDLVRICTPEVSRSTYIHKAYSPNWYKNIVPSKSNFKV